jgi:hypothetical protein
MDIVVTTTIRIKFERPLLLTICVYYTERKSVQVSYKLFSKLTSPSGDVGSIIVDEVNLENCFTCAQCRGTHSFRNYLTRHNQFSFHSPIRYLLSTPFNSSPDAFLYAKIEQELCLWRYRDIIIKIHLGNFTFFPVLQSTFKLT